MTLAATPAIEDDVTLTSNALEMVYAIAGGTGAQEDPWRSPDARTFVFASDAAGTKDIHLSTR